MIAEVLTEFEALLRDFIPYMWMVFGWASAIGVVLGFGMWIIEFVFPRGE